MLSTLKDDAMKLKLKFPFWRHKMSSTSSDVQRYSRRNGSESDSEVDELRGLHVSHKFLSCSVFSEFQEVFKNLDTRLKLCLLSFAVLLANAVVKRRLLINWWVGERLVDPLATGEKTAEDIVDEILTELKEKGFIEPVKERHKLVANRFKMQPLVHCGVIMLAQEAQLLVKDSNGNPTVKSSQCNRACLVKAEGGTSEQDLAPDLYPEKLQTIFNVNEPFPYIRFEWSVQIRKVNIVEWFSKMKNLNVLYLGRWKSSDQLHIEGKSSDQHRNEVQSSDQHHNEEQSSDQHQNEGQSSDHHHIEGQSSDHHHIEAQSSDQHHIEGQSADQHHIEGQSSDQHQIEGKSSDHHHIEGQSSDQHHFEGQSSDQHHIEGQSSDQHHIEEQHHNVRQGSHKNHIEVESTEFLKGFFKGLKNVKCFRLLSLQGISRISELPNSIGNLTNLRILDLKACYDLEALPDGIASLKKLSHLDISGCYLLDYMPKGLASLSELQVLKGFVIGNLESDRDNTHQGLPQPFLGGLCFPQNRDLCTLEDLIGLKKLSKLSINTRSKAFPTEKELKALRKLEALRKLAIAWSVDSKKKENGAAKPTRAPSRLNRIITGLNRIITGMRRDTETPELPTKLEKLELQCFPHTGTPDWLIPRKLERLKKLYIRGGKLINLGQTQERNENWKVEILRLKHLHEFNMDWNKLQRSFPELKLLENVDCPKLTSNQCDQFGVWLKH
jgi:hypothetical protein